MGKKKIDKLKLIDNKLQRNVAFCKRKRGFLKKAIELSSLCDQQILIIIYDKDRKRLVQFSSDSQFQFKAAYKAIKQIKESDNESQDNYERFTNEDYENLEKLDFRSIRYKKKHRYGENDEIISDLDDELQQPLPGEQSDSDPIGIGHNDLTYEQQINELKEDTHQIQPSSKSAKTINDRKRSINHPTDLQPDHETQIRTPITDTADQKTVKIDLQDLEYFQNKEGVNYIKKRDEKQQGKTLRKATLGHLSDTQNMSQDTAFGQNPLKTSIQLQQGNTVSQTPTLSNQQISINKDSSAIRKEQFILTSSLNTHTNLNQSLSLSNNLHQNDSFNHVHIKPQLVKSSADDKAHCLFNRLNQSKDTNGGNLNLMRNNSNQKQVDCVQNKDSAVNNNQSIDLDTKKVQETTTSMGKSHHTQISPLQTHKTESDQININQKLNGQDQKTQMVQQIENEILQIITTSTDGKALEFPEKLLKQITNIDSLQVFLENLIKKQCNGPGQEQNSEQRNVDPRTMNNMNQDKQQADNVEIEEHLNYSKLKEIGDQQQSNIDQQQKDLSYQLQRSLGPNNQKQTLVLDKDQKSIDSVHNLKSNQILHQQLQSQSHSNQQSKPSTYSQQVNSDKNALKFTEWIFDQIQQENNQVIQSKQQNDQLNASKAAKNAYQAIQNLNEKVDPSQKSSRQNQQSNNKIFNNFQNISGTPAMNPQGETPMFQAEDLKMDSQEKMPPVDLTGWGSLNRGNQGLQQQSSLNPSSSPLHQQSNVQEFQNLRNALLSQQKSQYQSQQMLPQQLQNQRLQRVVQQIPGGHLRNFNQNQMNLLAPNQSLQRQQRSFSNIFIPKESQQPSGMNDNTSFSKAHSSHGSQGRNKMYRMGSQSPSASNISNFRNNPWIANQILNTKAKRDRLQADTISQVSEDNTLSFINRNPLIPNLMKHKNSLISTSFMRPNPLLTPKGPTKSNFGADQKSQDNLSMGLFGDQIRDISQHKN